MHTLKLCPKVTRLIRQFRCKDFRSLVRLLYHCPVKPGFRALGQFLKVSSGAIRNAVGRNVHPHGGWYRTMENILKDLNAYVKTGTVDEQMLEFSPTLRKLIEHCGGTEQAKEWLRALARDHTRHSAAKMIATACGMVHADAQYMSDWCAQLKLQDLRFKTRSPKGNTNQPASEKSRKRIDPPEIIVAVPASLQKLMDSQNATAKDIAIQMWRRYRSIPAVVKQLGFKTTDALEALLRNFDPLFGVEDLQQMA